MSIIDEYIRYKALKDTLDKMSEDELKAFSIRVSNERRHMEVIDMLHRQGEQISRVADKIEKQNWKTDFLSDIAANFTTDAIIYLGSRLLKHI